MASSPSLSLPASANVNAVLDGLDALAGMVDLKNETLEKETAVLEAIIKRVTPLIPLLSKAYEHYYRRRIILSHDRITVPIDGEAYFYGENELILYENGQLVRTHRCGDYRESHGPSWEHTDEFPLTASAAVVAIGLDAIVTGIINALEEASETIILPQEVAARLIALSKILEDLR